MHSDTNKFHSGDTPYGKRNVPNVLNFVSSHLFSTLMPMLTEEIQSNLEGSLAVFEEKNGALPVHRYVISNYCAGGIIQLCKSWFLHPETMSKEDLFAQYHTMISLFFATISPELS